MTRNIYTSALLTLILAANSLFAVVPEFKAPKLPPFSHYEGILQRMPFGAGPPPDAEMALSPEDAKDAAKEEIEKQKLARQINMSCVNITPSGVPAVGFSDLSEKTPVNFYLLVGASGGGWTLLSASYEEEWAELEKDGTTIFVKLGKGLMDGPPTKDNAVAEKSGHKKKKGQIALDQSKQEPEIKERDPMLDEPKEIQTAYLRAIELSGGPPMPNISVATIPSEVAAEIEADRSQIIALRQKGINTKSYRQRLLEKKQQAELARQSEEEQKLNAIEEVARMAARTEIEQQISDGINTVDNLSNQQLELFVEEEE